MSPAAITAAVGIALGIVISFLVLSSGLPRPIRWLVVLTTLLVATAPALAIALFLSAQPEPVAPDDRPAVGLRVDRGVATIWLPKGCEEATQIEVRLQLQDSPDWIETTLRSSRPIAVDRFGLTPDTVPRGMAASPQLRPEQLDLSRYQMLAVESARSDRVKIKPAIAESARRSGQYWFGEPTGWLSADDVISRAKSNSMASICEPVR